MLNVVRAVSPSRPQSIIPPMLAAFIDITKAGIFSESAIKGMSFSTFLQMPLTVLKGVSAAGAALIAQKGIVSLKDLCEKAPELLIGTEPTSAKAAYAAQHVMLAALQKYGIRVKFAVEGGIHTMAIFMDPATGISYSR